MLRAERLPAEPCAVERLQCITQDAKEPASDAYLAICDDTPVHLTCSIYCPPECGGHMVCDPC